MYKINILMLILLMFSISLSATVLEVGLNQDFTYNTIQSAVDAAVDYDTVLVHPGRYIENVEVLEKSLTLGSLFLTTGDEAYIDSTIIDGNDEDTVLKIYHNRYVPELKYIKVNGLSITGGNTLTDHFNENEGRNYKGGGINILGYSYLDSEFSSVEYCKIFNNTSSTGGGIAIFESNICIKACEIFNNNGGRTGGGIYSVGIDYQLELSEAYPNSVYNNSAGKGRDVYIEPVNSNPAYLNGLYFDKISVAPEGDFSHYYYVSDVIEWDGELTYNEYVYERIEADLYVSPTGNDNNTGLSPAQALKTISKASSLLKARANGDYNIIHVAPGLYSPDTTGEIFPISMDRGTKLVGAGSADTILDGENQICNFFYLEDNSDISVSGFSCKNLYSRAGWAGIVRANNVESLQMKDLNIENIHTDGVFVILYSSNILVEDINLKNYNYDGFIIAASQGIVHNIWADSLNVTMEVEGQPGSMPFLIDQGSYRISNIAVTNSVIPGGRAFSYGSDLSVSDDFVTVNNLLVANCSYTPLDWNYTTVGFIGEHLPQMKVNNMTLVNNTNNWPILGVRGDVKIRNSIFDNPNSSYEIYLMDPAELPIPGTSALDIDYSLVRGGIDALVTDYDEEWILNWGDNMLDVDPVFAGGDETLWSSYFLAEDSPCIDAGIPDTTGFYMTAMDLNGCERVYGSAVDLGCFEYGAPVGNNDNGQIEAVQNKIMIYPNPAQLNNGLKGVTTIEFTLKGAKAKDIRVGVYNIKGQKVRDLRVGESFYNNLKADDPTYSLHWDLKNNRGKNVTSGIYFIKADDGNGHSVVTKSCVMK
ncbi:hypothetical protein JEZ13_11710 [bacterium]|nr:hypothetical protein [bacterium]